MERQLEELQARLEALARELGEVRRRVASLEERRRVAPREPPSAAPDEAAEAAEASAPAVVGSLLPARTTALIGRTLVVLGGAYLLRAITETGVIPALAGPLAGLAYATWWLVLMDRTASRGERLGAAFHGFAAVLIAYPLIWEVTFRFELLGAASGAVALLSFSVLALAVAWRRELPEIAWTIVLFALATTLSLVVGTHHYLPYAIALLALAAVIEGLAFRDRWLPLRWPAAVGLDLAVVMMAAAALGSDPPLAGHTAAGRAASIGVALGLPALYLASIAARTLVRERPVMPFEMVQAAAALLVGFGSAVRLIGALGADPAALGSIVFVLGAACYAAAFASIDRRLGRGRNFYTYTTLGGVLVLVGSHMLLAGAARTLTWSALAVAAVVAGARFDRITLKFHGAVYVAAAATAGGVVLCAFDGLVAGPPDAWRPVTPLGLTGALVAAVCYGILVATPGRSRRQWFELLPQAITGAVVVWSVAGMAAPWVARMGIGASQTGAEAAFLAASRTAVIAILAVALAWAGRRWSLEELLWLVYPLLVGGGAKLLWEDFRYGQPMTLFVAFAFYGGALILTPRWIRKETQAPAPTR